MKVLFVVTPAHGHFNPVVPLARALAAARHDVRVATSRSFCGSVAEAGLRPLPAGMDWLESDFARFFPRLADLDPVRQGMALGSVFDYFVPRSMLPDLQAVAAAWRPDLVVNEPGGTAGQLLAELRGLPWATVCGSIPVFRHPASFPTDEAMLLELREVLAGPHSRGGLRRELGLPGEEPEPWLFLDMVPPSLHLLSARHLLRNAHPLRPVPFNLGGAEDADWAWMARQADERPTLLVGLGTVFHRAPDALRAVLQGTADLRCSVVVSIGDLDPAQLGPVPANARLLPWVPHDRVLPRCAVFVNHGGTGGVMKSLVAGIPMLVLPQAANQFISALRVRSSGAGRFLLPVQVTPDAVRREVRRLLEDPVHRLNARRLQAEIAEMPPPEHGVALLERLATERQPIAGEEPLPTF